MARSGAGGDVLLTSLRAHWASRIGLGLTATAVLVLIAGQATAPHQSINSPHDGQPIRPVFLASDDVSLPMASSSTSYVVAQPDGQPSAFVDQGGALWNYWFANGSMDSAEIVAGGVASNPVAVDQPDGEPSVFFQGAGGTLWNYWYANGNWGGAEIAGGGVASAPAAILQANGAPTVFVEGPGDSLLNYWYIPAQGTWGAGTAAPAGSIFSAPAVIWQVNAGDAPSVFAEGPGNSLLNYWYIPAQGTWGASTVASPGRAFSAPSVMAQVSADYAPSVFVEGPGNSLINYWYIPAQGTWGAGTVSGPGTAHSTPAVVPQVNAGDVPSVFVEGPGNSLLNYWYIPAQGTWGAGTVSGQGTTDSAPGVIDGQDGAPTVFCQGPSGSPFNFTYTDGTWVDGPSASVPSGSPYFTFSATLSAGGSGTGYSAYINARDADNDAVGIGLQTLQTSGSGPVYYIWETVQNGNFNYGYLGPAPSSNVPVTLAWWQGDNTAVFYEGSTPVADIPISLTPMLYFGIEGDGRQNGDSVNDVFTNTQITVGDNCPTYCGLTGTWNTTQFNSYGLTANQTNSASQNGADFTVTGTVSGLPPGGNWGNAQVAGIALIQQYWNGQ
ncbi:MAG TPA: hypothetical protein VK386_01905 [Acidimicrobiales bacterium]|nr:hypothetical protein [Acidimicrobiales bacterium]